MSYAPRLIDHSGSFSPLTYEDNTYFSNASSSAWFRVNGTNQSYAQWLSASDETESSAGAVTHPDPDRDEATYQASLGGTPTMAAFAEEARLQSKANWRPANTAAAMNAYVREGFGR